MRFDYVIVGNGSAGGVLASRLSEDPATSVLVLEAGPDFTTSSTPPAIASANAYDAMQDPNTYWPDVTARRTHTQAAALYLRGRGAGGSSSINGMALRRPDAGDLDAWERHGAAGWNHRTLAPYIDKALATVTHVESDEAGWTVLDRAFVEAVTEAGHHLVPNPTDGPGLSPIWFNRHGTRRVSINDAYVEAARSRPNLHVRGDALVSHVILDGPRAEGVALLDGEVIEAGHVVVCAGAIHSPAILLRSGVDRPGVGRHLRDHPTAVVVLPLKPEAVADYGTPPVTLGLRASSGQTPFTDWQLVPTAYLGPGPASGVAGLLLALTHVVSTGYVTLASNDPVIAPTAVLNMLADDSDRRRMVQLVRHALALLDHDAFTKVIAGRFFTQVAHGLADGVPEPVDPSALDDDATLERWLVDNAYDHAHAAGTCRMGAIDDDQAVVDPMLSVIGYRNLSVVDASVFPDLVSTVPHLTVPHLTVLAVAERAADLFRARSA